MSAESVSNELEFGILSVLVFLCRPSSVDQSRLSMLWLHAGKQSKRGGTCLPKCYLVFRWQHSFLKMCNDPFIDIIWQFQLHLMPQVSQTVNNERRVEEEVLARISVILYPYNHWLHQKPWNIGHRPQRLNDPLIFFEVPKKFVYTLFLHFSPV